jgi:hypothetical protein
LTIHHKAGEILDDDPLGLEMPPIPSFLKKESTPMHNEQNPADTGISPANMTITAKVDASDAIAAVKAEMAALTGEPPAEDMTIEEAQKRLSDMVKQRDKLDVGIKASKKYITKKIAAL